MPDALDLFTLAWRDSKGYVCLSLRNPTIGKDQPGYWKDVVMKWPEDRTKIQQVVKSAATDNRDLYWSPAVYASPTRAKEGVLGRVHTLWADLDEVNPKSIPKHLKPTAVWESSPGRYQAIWLLDRPLSPKEQSELNQRLTYALGADKGGWDLTQVLRTPGTRNHKYEAHPPVRLLYLNGHTIDPDAIQADLPDLFPRNADVTSLEDPKAVMSRHKLPARAKELIRARHATVGQRSDRLWELACLLAEAGLNESEIVSITIRTVWNKFNGRADELDRLFSEATKAIDHVAPAAPIVDVLVVDESEDVGPVTWGEFDSEHRPIRWLVADIWGESEVGFISGLPKSYKSWLALDLAVSVASGTDFLGTFQSRRGNVLLIQEEDPRVILQDRLVKIGAAKELIKVTPIDERTFEMTYDLPDNLFIISNQGFTLNEEWMELLEQWVIERDIKMLILDPLMMIAGGGFDEFKAFEFMEKVLKPLKRLRARTRAAVVLVHHHLKGSQSASARDMYGSVALWAWEEAALHLQVSGVGKVTAERFSKHALLAPVTLEVGDVSERWSPTLSMGGPSGGTSGDVYDVLLTMEAGATVDDLVGFMGISRETVTKQLKHLEQEGKVEKAGTLRTGGRPKVQWRATV